MRALLVHPDPDVRDALRRLLGRRGWEVTEAGADLDTLADFSATPFPLVVVGMQLPGDAGLEFCRAVRNTAAGRAAFLLAVTDEPAPESVARLAEAGVDDYLLQPLSAPEVEGRLAFAEAHLFTNPAPAGSGPVLYQQRILELEEHLRVERASLAELFQSAPEGVAIVDSDDRVLQINGEFTRMFGYTAEEAEGQPINELIVPRQLWEEGLSLTHAVTRGERITLETLRRHRDGRMIDVSVLATPIQLEGGPIGAYGLYRDITERKAQEAALRESEERYRALFDQSPVGVALCDRHFRVTHCNERLPQILRASPEQVVGLDLTRVADERILPAVRQALAGEPASYEGPYQTATSGVDLWISAMFSPLRDAAGRVVGGIAVVEDTTERQEADQRLRAQAAELERVNSALRERTLELEEAMQARSRLYTALNHELRTPISAIMLYQELLLTGALGPLPAEQKQALEHSHTAARHLLDLVRDVLDLSRLEAGKVSLQPVPFALEPLLDDLLATALPFARRYGSDLHLEPGPDPLMLVTDPQRVRQILLNFTSNAAKYGRGRPIRVRYAASGDGEAVIEVSDEGIGIAPGDLPRIFEDFFQVGTGPDSGTGLGLPICRRLADLLHGRLEVESELGVGSTFRLILPRALPQALQLTPEA